MNNPVRLTREELVKMWRRWTIVGFLGAAAIITGVWRENDYWLYPGLLLWGLGLLANLAFMGVWIKRLIRLSPMRFRNLGNS